MYEAKHQYKQYDWAVVIQGNKSPGGETVQDHWDRLRSDELLGDHGEGSILGAYKRSTLSSWEINFTLQVIKCLPQGVGGLLLSANNDLDKKGNYPIFQK